MIKSVIKQNFKFPKSSKIAKIDQTLIDFSEIKEISDNDLSFISGGPQVQNDPKPN